MTKFDHQNLDFDRLLNLAENDPKKFEGIRQEVINSFINSLPDERQILMRRLQWRIDQERKNRSPLSACLRISSLMWDSLVGPRGLQWHLQYFKLEERQLQPDVSGRVVVAFPSRRGVEV
ncbi:MAG: DUF3135 domain-containing protein [Candidatus Thiodiazotropha sp.]